MKRPRLSPLWRHGDFVKLWTGQSISVLGGAVSDVAFPLVAIVTLSASAFEVSAVRALMFVPFLLFALPAGVWIDRIRRRPVVIWCDLGLGLLLATIPIAYWLDVLTIWQVFAVAFATGVLEVFFGVAYRSYLPSVVPRERLVEANAKLDTAASAAAIAGPGIGGALVAAVTAPVVILVDAISFFVSAAFGLAIRTPEPRPERAPDRHLGRELKEGLAFVLHHPYLRPIALTTSALNFARSMVVALFLVYAVRELDVSVAVLGVILAVGNVGTLIGAAATERLTRTIGIGRTIVLGAGLIAPSTMLIALAPESAPVPFLVASQVLVAIGAMAYSIGSVSLRQSVTPERLLGRMNSVMVFIGFGAAPLGAIAGGILAAAFGLHAAIWVGALLALVTVLPLILSPVRSLASTPAPETAL